MIAEKNIINIPFDTEVGISGTLSIGERAEHLVNKDTYRYLSSIFSEFARAVFLTMTCNGDHPQSDDPVVLEGMISIQAHLDAIQQEAHRANLAKHAKEAQEELTQRETENQNT